MARNRKLFIVRLDESLAAERKMIIKTLKEGSFPDFDKRIFLFQYIRRLEAIVLEHCSAPGVVSINGLNEWSKAIWDDRDNIHF